MPNPTAKLSAKSTIAELADSALLDQLSGPQLVVFIRLLKSCGSKRTSSPTNGELYARDERTAVRALKALEEAGLVSVKLHPKVWPGRTVTVL